MPGVEETTEKPSPRAYREDLCFHVDECEGVAVVVVVMVVINSSDCIENYEKWKCGEIHKPSPPTQAAATGLSINQLNRRKKIYLKTK